MNQDRKHAIVMAIIVGSIFLVALTIMGNCAMNVSCHHP